MVLDKVDGRTLGDEATFVLLGECRRSRVADDGMV